MMPVYQGVPRQYGYGLGSIFRTALRTAIPFVKPIAGRAFQTLKREGLKQGIKFAKDVLHNNMSPKDAFKTRGKRLLGAVAQSATGTKGGKKRKRSQSVPRSQARRTSHKRALPKRSSRTVDIFD